MNTAAAEIRTELSRSGRVWTDHAHYWTPEMPPTPGISAASAVDPEALPTKSAAINISLTCTSRNAEETLSWGEMVIAAQETSFAFLRDEPDLYTDADGEPV